MNFSVIYAIFKLKWLKSRQHEKKIFHIFWLWVLAIIGLFEFVPLWMCEPFLFYAAFATMCLAMLADFLYYYGIKTTFVKQQIISAIWLIPVVFYFGRPLWSGGPTVTLPWYGAARVWTDSTWNARTWYFMTPGPRDQGKEDYHNPDFGKAVIAPVSGVVLGWFDGDFLMMITQDGKSELAVGPMMADSVKLKPGDQVFEKQPLGLIGNQSGPIPGLQLRVLQGDPIRFRNVHAGRVMGFGFTETRLYRNQMVAFDAQNKMNFSPASED